jgi:transposase
LEVAAGEGEPGDEGCVGGVAIDVGAVRRGDAGAGPCTEPQDMRRSFDGLALATTQILGKDPRSGALFVLFNKRSTQARVLWWDTNGYCLLSKRLHPGALRHAVDAIWRFSAVSIDGRALATLLAGVEKRRRGRDG